MRISLLILSCFVLYFVIRIFQPFLMPLSLAVVLSTLCYPVFDWTCQRVGGRRNWASLFTCIWVTTIIIVPFVLVVILLAGEVADVYQRFQVLLESGRLDSLANLEEIPYLGPIQEWLRRYPPLQDVDLVGSLASGLREASLFFLRQSTTILSGLFHLIGSFLIMLISMFFLFRDGSRLVEELKALIPLSKGYQNLIIDKLRQVAKATVLGALATALAQGVAGGLLFWIVGVSNSLFWGFIMAFAALVPLAGTGIVWVPWVLYFLATGALGKAALLAGGGALVSLIDNVLRPLFIEGTVEMHTLVVFFSILGGISYFGMAGVIFGPILVALGLTFLELFKLEFRQGMIAPTEE